MLRPALIVIPVVLAIMFGIDWGTSSLVHPCFDQIKQSNSDQQPQNAAQENRCSYKGGVVVEGFAFVAGWHPEVWIALGTIVIAIFTTILGLFTVSLAKSTRLAAEHIPRVERAYVYGGFGGRDPIPDGHGGFSIETSVSMANYGKTPGFIRFIEFGASPINELPDRPIFQQSIQISDLYFPEMTMNEVRLTNARLRIPGDGSYAVFQRVHYKDVLGNHHFSGSVYQLFVVQNNGQLGVADRPLRPDSAYWFTDEDQAEQGHS